MSIDQISINIEEDRDESVPLMTNCGSDKVLPIVYTFNNLKYTMKKKKTTTTLLNGVSGVLNPGTVLAIMGPSGAGKTTLLDILAGRATKGHLEGQILLNGQSRQEKQFRRISGYVMQDDSLLDALTVFETLNVTAMLKLPDISKEERHKRVNEVIKQLGLWKVRDCVVGSQFKRGISGGERRRVAIGVELITKPSILFLDEPTSGLDGSSAYIVMKTIIDLAKTGCILVCTIHQPRANIYNLFEQLMLLKGGEVAFYGPAHDAVSYLSNAGFAYDPNNNPSDWMLDLINTSPSGGEEQCAAIPPEVKKQAMNTDFGSLYRSSAYHKQIINQLSVPFQPDASSRRTEEEMKKLSRWASPLWWQIVVLIYRNTINNFRNPAVIWVRLVQALFMAVLVGSIFFQVPDTDDGIQARTSAMFFVCTYQILSSFAGLPMLIEERGRFNREIQANMYSTFAYFSALFFSTFPLLVLFAVAFGTTAYWLVGFQASAAKFGFFLLAITCMSLTGDAMCKAISALVPTFSIANAIASIIVTFFMIFGGFFIKTSSLPIIWRWAPYISLFNYGFNALMVNEYLGLTFTCDPSQMNPLTGQCIVPNGAAALTKMGINPDSNIWLDIVYLVLIWLGFRTLQLIFLTFFNKEKR